MSDYQEKRSGHFLAKIDIFPCGPENDRRDYPAFNRTFVRWGFSYADDYQKNPKNPGTSDIWPEFIDSTGVTIADDVPLIGTYMANMHIISDTMINMHFERLSIGTIFYCMDGPIRVAEGTVVEIF